MAKKIKKAILAGLTAYAASKVLGKPPSPLGDKGKSMDHMLTQRKPDVLEGKGTRGRDPTWWEKYVLRGRTVKKGDWFNKGGLTAQVWKKHGGAIKVQHARVGKLIKAAQGTYAKEDESLGMRLGKGKGTAKERDMSYGDWGKRKKDWAKSGKMIKARYGTEVRTMGSNPHVPKGGTAYVKTKLNGTLKVKTF